MRFFLFLFLISNLFAAELDTIPRYILEEISIEGEKLLETKIITTIDEKSIEKTGGISLSEISRLLPSVKMQTNSRGEVMLHLRGSSERQVMIFFDGIPLNTPWDNRIDAGLIPSDAIGNVQLTRGIPSVLYGANAMTGVIKIQSRQSEKNSNDTKLNLFGGQNNEQYYNALHSHSGENFSFLISSSYYKTDGYSLPSNFSHPQQNSSLRIRSDKKSFNFFSRGAYNLTNRTKLGLTAIYLDAEKGVPFELDAANPRYWYYPEWKNYTFALNGEHIFNTSIPAHINFTFSGVKQKSRIEQFTDITYSQTDDIEVNDDLTFNGNVILTQLIKKNSLLKLGINGFTSTHKEKFLSGNFTETVYVQNMISAGAEYEFFTKNVIAVAGIGIDAASTPKTGDKETKKALSDFAFILDAVYSPYENISLHLSVGRKTRFPTLRESFSGALGRFVPNPNLKAESALTVESGFGYLFTNGDVEMNLFLTHLKDGIVRVSLPDKQFQRVNKEQIRIAGAEFSNRLFFFDKHLSTILNITYLTANAKNSTGNFSDTLEYKPAVMASLQLLYETHFDVGLLVEINYSGNEFALKEGNLFFERIPDYFLAAIRLSYHLKISSDLLLEFYSRVDNLFDKLYYRQLGLPEEGRSFTAGITIKF